MAHIVIIGNGISGVTCARLVRKRSDDEITIISSETEHFYARTALMYIYMGHMKYEHTKPYEDNFWKKNNITLVHQYVEKVDAKNKNVTLKNGNSIQYDKLVLACGSKSNVPDIQGKDLLGIQSLYNYQDLQNMEINTKGVKNAVILGGGLIGIEMAEMLLSRNIHVTMLVREVAYWGGILPEEEAKMIGRHIAEHHIDLLLGSELSEIIGNKSGSVKAVKTKKGETIPCEFVGIAIGVGPNVSFLKDSGIEIDRGVLINDHFETNIPDIFAVGDCAQFKEPPAGRKPIEQVWYTGRMHAETLAKTLLGKRTRYQPGPWFNSAKFLDIEYQTYGDVPVKINEDEKGFYWEHDNRKISFRARYHAATGRLLGVNTFGMRLRHGVLENWILNKQNIEYVLSHLADANFDPEFFRTYEEEIIRKFNKENNTQLKTVKKSWKRLLQILNL
ncbi:MAG: NAD(P)/FAD-dependent oxidoreductase [Taibaiella sp.]|nr:NAD(P)/FAD-dependent oxidoreductase [Taibaiella sp.]